jgi:hypothetical protein
MVKVIENAFHRRFDINIRPSNSGKNIPGKSVGVVNPHRCSNLDRLAPEPTWRAA